MNQAMLAKASWSIHNGDSGLWAFIYRRKFLTIAAITNRNLHAPKYCSNTWKSIAHGPDLLKQGLIWRVGDGKTINFWTDIWLPPLPLNVFFLFFLCAPLLLNNRYGPLFQVAEMLFCVLYFVLDSIEIFMRVLFGVRK